MKEFIKSYWLLLFITFLGILLRFYLLSDIPISLNQDETALGYNAYAILKTGADEYGKFLPLSLQSFGDWKLPLYPVIGIIPIIFLGLTEFAVRLPSTIAGVIAIPLLYILAAQLFQNKKIALLAAFFLAVSPWGIFFSRVAYEANVATTLFLGGLVCFLRYYYGRKQSSTLMLFAAVLWGLTIFTYHAFVLFMPLFFIGVCYLLIKDKRLKEKITLFAVIIFCGFALISAFVTITQGSVTKLSSTSLLHDKNTIYQRAEIMLGDNAKENEYIKKILYNKYVAVIYQIGQNYIATFSPAFLFDKGGEKLMHNIGNFGNFYLFDFFLLIAGIGGMLWRKEKRLEILLIWLLVGPIPSAITVDSPSSTRLFLMLPLFILTISYGSYVILEKLSDKHLITLFAKYFIIFLFLFNFIFFLDAYYVHMNIHRARYFHFGYKQAVELSRSYPDYKIIMRGPENFPYVSFLFYEKYDPVTFRKQVLYYPQTDEGFQYVKSFGRYSFVDHIDYSKLSPKTIYFDDTRLGDPKNTIFLPNGDPLMGFLINR